MSERKNSTIIRDYWEKNIENFSGFYDKKSEETLSGSKLITGLYKRTIFPIEKKYMLQRFRIVSDFIQNNVRAGMSVVDIGCGCGIFVKQMAQRGASVLAADYANSALQLAKRNLEEEESKMVEFQLLDITREHIPPVDLAISIGVLTYIDDSGNYFSNILPYTKRLLFNFLNADNPLNGFRRAFPILNVRHLSYHRLSEIKAQLAQAHFAINKVTPLASGFVIDCQKDG